VAEIVNLNAHRKRKLRAEKQAKAAANRAAHGRTKAQTQQDGFESHRASKDLDGKRRDGDEI